MGATVAALVSARPVSYRPRPQAAGPAQCSFEGTYVQCPQAARWLVLLDESPFTVKHACDNHRDAVVAQLEEAAP